MNLLPKWKQILCRGLPDSSIVKLNKNVRWFYRFSGVIVGWRESLLSLPRKWLSTQMSGTEDDECPHVTVAKLPVPELQATINAYLDFTSVLLSPQQQENTQELAKKFCDDMGPKLQNILQQMQKDKINWKIDWVDLNEARYREENDRRQKYFKDQSNNSFSYDVEEILYQTLIENHVHDDLTTLCCVNGSLTSSCKERISIQNTNLEKYALKVGAFRNTLRKIKSLVTFYTENSELNASEMDINECDQMKNDENILQTEDLVHEFFPKQEINHTNINKEKNGQIWKSYNSAYGSIQNSHKRDKLSKRHTTEEVSPIPNVSFINKIDNNITSLIRSTVSVITTKVKSSQSKELTKPIVLESNPMLNNEKIIRMTSDQQDKITFSDTAMPTSNGMITNATSLFTLRLANNTLNQQGFTTPILRHDYGDANNFADTNSYFTIQLSLTQNNFSSGPNLSLKTNFVTSKTNENDVSEDLTNFDNPKVPITNQHVLSDTRSPASGNDFQEKYQNNLIDQSSSNNDSFISATTIGSFEKTLTHTLPLISQTETYVSRSTPVYLSNQSITTTTLTEETFSNSRNLTLSEVSPPTQVYLTNAHKFILPTSSNDLQHNRHTYVPASLQFRGSNDLSSQTSLSTQNNLRDRLSNDTLKIYMQEKYQTNLKGKSMGKNKHMKSLHISTPTQRIFNNSLGPAYGVNFEYNEDDALKNVKNDLSPTTITQTNIINGQSLATTTSDKNIHESNTELNYVLNRRFNRTKTSDQNTTAAPSSGGFQILSTVVYLTEPISNSGTLKNIQEKSSVPVKFRIQDRFITTTPIINLLENSTTPMRSSQQSLITTIKGSKKKSTRKNRTAINNFTGQQILSLTTPYNTFKENVKTPVVRDNFQDNNYNMRPPTERYFSKQYKFSSTTFRYDKILMPMNGENNNDFTTLAPSTYKGKSVFLRKTQQLAGLNIKNDKNNTDLLWKNEIPNLSPDSTYNIYMKNTQVYLSNVHKFILTTSRNNLQHSHQTYVPASLQFRGSNDLSSRNVSPSIQNNIHARLNETTLKKIMQEKYQTNTPYGVTKNYLTSRESLRRNYDTHKALYSQTNKNNHIQGLNISTSTQSIFKNSLFPAIRNNLEYNGGGGGYNGLSLNNVKNDLSSTTSTQHNNSYGQTLATSTSDKNIQENNTELNFTLNRRFRTETSDQQNTTPAAFRDAFQILSTALNLTDQSISVSGTLKNIQDKSTAQDNLHIQEILIKTTPINNLLENSTTPIQSSQQSIIINMVKGNKKKTIQQNKTAINNFTGQQILSLVTPYNKFKEKVTRLVIRDNVQEHNQMKFKGEKDHAQAIHHQPTRTYFSKGYKFSSTTFRYDKILVQINSEDNNDFTTLVPSTRKENKKKLLRKTHKSTELTIKNNDSKSDLLWKTKIPTLSPDPTFNINKNNTQVYLSNAHKFILTTSRNNLQHSHQTYVPTSLQFRESNDLSSQNVSPSTQSILRARFKETTLKKNMQEKYQTNTPYGVTKNYLTSRESLRRNYDTHKAPYSQTNKNYLIKGLNISTSTQSLFKNRIGPANRDNFEYNENDGLEIVKNNLTPSTITQYNISNGQSLATMTNKNLSLKNIQENNAELNYILNRSFSSMKSSYYQNTTTAVSRDEFQKLKTSLYPTDKPILIIGTLKNNQEKNTVQDNLRIQDCLITMTPKNSEENSTTPIQSSQKRLITNINGSEKKSTQKNRTAMNNFTGKQILSLATPYYKLQVKVTVPKTHYHPNLTTPVTRDNVQKNNQMRFKGVNAHAHATHYQPTQRYFIKEDTFSSTILRYDKILVQMNDGNNNNFTISVPSAYKENKKKLLRKTQKSTGLTVNNKAINNSYLLRKNEIPNLAPDTTYNINIKNATDLRKAKYTLITAENDIITNPKKEQLLVTQFNISQQSVGKFKNVNANYFDKITSTSNISPKPSDIQLQVKPFLSRTVPSSLKTVMNKDIANRSVNKSNIVVPKTLSAHNVNLKHNSSNNPTLILQDNLQYIISNNNKNETLRIVPTDVETNIELNVSRSKNIPLGINSAVHYKNIEDTLTNLASTTISPLWTMTKSLDRLLKLKKATKHYSTYFTIKTYYPNNIGFNSQMFTTTVLFPTPKSGSSIQAIRIGNQKEITLYSDASVITNYTMGYNGSNNLSSTKQTKSIIEKNIEGTTKHSSPKPLKYNQTEKITTYNLKATVTEYKVNNSNSVATLRHQKEYTTVTFPSETWMSSKILTNISNLENSSVKAETNAISTPHRKKNNRTRTLNLSQTTALSHFDPGKLTYFINRNSNTAKKTTYQYASNKSTPTPKIILENVTRRIYKKIQVEDTKILKNKMNMLIVTTDSSSKNVTIQTPTSQFWNNSNRTSVQENSTTTLNSLQSESHQGQLNVHQSITLQNKFRYRKTKNNRAFTASNSLKQWRTLLPLTEPNIKLWTVKTLSPKLLTDVQNGLLLLNQSHSHTTQPVQSYPEKATTSAIKLESLVFTNVIKPSIAYFTTQFSKKTQTGQNILRGVTENERDIIFNNTVPATKTNNKFTVQQSHIKKTTEISIFSKYRKPNDIGFANKDNYFTMELKSKAAKYSNAMSKTKAMNLISENIMNTSKKNLYNKKPSDITTLLLPTKIINVQNTTRILSSITEVNNGGTGEYNNSTTMNYNTGNVSLLSKQFNKKISKHKVSPTSIDNDLIKKSVRITSPVNIIDLKVSIPTEVVATSQRLLKSETSKVKEMELEIDRNLTTTKHLPMKTPTETFLKTTNSITPIKQDNKAFTRHYPFKNIYTMGVRSENMNLLGTTFTSQTTKIFDDHLSILKHNFGFNNITSIQNKTLLLSQYKIAGTGTASYENKATQELHLQNRSMSPSQNIQNQQNVTNSNQQTNYCSDVYKAVYLQNIYLNIPILVANHNDVNVCNFSYNIVENTTHSNYSNIISKNKLSDYLKNISTFISSKIIDQKYSSEKDTQNVFENAFKFKQMNPKTEIILTKTAWPMTTESKNIAYLKTNPNRNLNLLPTEGKFSYIATEINRSTIKPAKVSIYKYFTTAPYSSTRKTLTTSSFINVLKAKSITPLLKVKKIRYNTYKPKTEEDLDTTILKFNKKKFSTINTVQKLVTNSDYRLLSRTTNKEEKISNNKNKYLNHQKYSGVPKVPVKDMRTIIVHTKSVIDPLAKTNLYPVQRIPSTSQRKVMKRIRLHKNKELLAMDTNDFFSRRHIDVHRESGGNSHGILRKGYLTPKPKEYIIRPTFKMIDKPRSFRPKPILIESDSFYKNHFPRNRGKGSALIEQVDYVRDTTKEPQTVLERPAYLPPQRKPKFFRDRIDSIRNYVHNSDYLRASDSAGEIDRYAVYREPEFNFRRHEWIETTTNIRTTVKYTRRKPRTIFFLSPTVTDWWLDDMYLKVRLPLPINSSPGMVFPRKHFAKMDEVADLAALYIDDLLDYKEMLDRDELPQERATSREKGQPLCMEQFYRLLGVCRVPGVGKDRLSLPIPPPDPDNCEELVIVACRNYFYAVPVKAPDRGRLSAGEIQAQLLHALVDASAAPAAPRVGLLTAMNRDDWARAREQLFKDENNRNNLELLNRALCLVCLDESGGDRRDCDSDTNALLRAMHGAGTQHHSANRWFDKTVQLIISSDGTVGMCYEHSPAEGVAVVRLAERALERAEVADRPKPPPTLLPAPERLQWKLTPELNSTIEKAALDFDRAIKDLDLRVYTYRSYGREYMKSCRTSPDVYIQLALQYAYFKMYGHLVSTYESCSLRRFRNGRVDNIRSSHSAALAWATAMCAPESPATAQTDDGQKKVSFDLQEGQKKIDLFYEAARKQTTIMEANIQGQGTDNHMLGLREAARETFGSLPPLFTDPAYQKMIEFKLSTSQVATTTEGTFMGYGAVVPDGYGCSYNPKKDHVIFCISSFVASNVTSTEAFRQSLEEALDSMKALFDSRKNEK
ncbi:unnamed protein product [Pieris brassicae]|uniref:Choline O-acetyltransferase n=1 Tax=Pieris brassicae TaxID=7116 RepID=A0A9P0X1D7_PIEBR|nr:unnamed protein product [Pieris brassicae]